MSPRLNIPPELQHLIEKREQSERRQSPRRAGEEQRQLDLGPAGGATSAEDLEALSGSEQRSGTSRRKPKDRRGKPRR
jgi:hypothetical protein